MARPEKQNRSRLTLVFIACVVILLALVLGMLVIRCRTLEQELDRVLLESLTAHTIESGDGVKDLIKEARTVLDNAAQALLADGRPLEDDWVLPLLETMNLRGQRFNLYSIGLSELSRGGADPEEQRAFSQVLSGEPVVSEIITPSDPSNAHVLVIHPLERNGVLLGAVAARLNAELLISQGRHSSLFQTVHGVLIGEDGYVVYGSVPGSVGLSLTELGKKDGLDAEGTEKFSSAYSSSASGSFRYDAEDGRHYAAWSSAFYNGWRVVQFSQSPDIRIAQTSMVQTVVMVVSLALCVLLCALAWQQRRRLMEEQLRYNALSEFRDTLLFEYNCDDDSLEFTSNALDTLDLENVRLEKVTWGKDNFPVLHPDDWENVRRVLQSARSMAPDQIEHDRIRMKKRNGEYNWYRSQYKAILSPDGHSLRLIGTLTDISMQLDREQELRKQAQQDPLTGLYNRAGVKLINARLEQISRGVLFMLDLDDFKFVNDTYGHAAGDKLLIAIGQILTETFRTDDIVARVGGDEFVAFLSGSDNRATAEQKGQELLERVRTLKIEGIDTPASVSVGAASAPTCGRTYETLSQVADEALYQVKNNKKGGFCLR